MVWFYGGSFVLGGSSTFDGDELLSRHRDAILVTVNYRLGALGWLGGAAVEVAS